MIMTNDPLEKQIGALLREKGWYLATAESCTGGLIGDRLTNIPGSSDYYRGGVVAYANTVKTDLLGVSPATLETHGAVSRETVFEMSEGVRRVLKTEVGLSVSGIAGPSGGTPEKPVGTIWIGLSTPAGTRTKKIQARGNRLENKQAGAAAALTLLHEHLTAPRKVEKG